MPFGQSKASVSLDALRGIAALLVCSDHCRHIFFVEYHDLASKAFLLPYLATSLGHQSVVIFFVLSGFLVGGSVFRSLDQNRWSWRRYLAHRFVRLWLVLIPALVLCLGWDLFADYLRQQQIQPVQLLQHLPDVVAAPVITQRLDLPPNRSVGIFLGNVLFLQRITVPTFGTNGPLWSLSNEFWYYILFPLGMLTLRGRQMLTRLGMALAFLLVSWFVGKDILFLFPIWIVGALLYYVPTMRTSFPVRAAATVAYAVTLAAAVQLARGHSMLSDYLLTVSTSAYIWLLLGARQRSSKGAGERMARGLARFSYTLYLVHMPFLIFIGGLLVRHTLWMPHPVTISLAFVFWLAALLYAWLLAHATEFKADAAKSWVEKQLLRI